MSTDVKPVLATALSVPVKSAPGTAKVVAKVVVKEPILSPTPLSPAMDEERTELLGSLTTQQQQRTSARVIKKLRLEPPGEKRVNKRPDGTCEEGPECETQSKMEEKDPTGSQLKFPTVKQRMPKALWSIDEKNLFFEALNEYGKDFDAITAYICAKMKKKGMPDVNLKTKTQVSHFYYRTWHKLSKHVQFDENVKKVAQELYALINYGELRKKLVSVNEKTCARLGEMVLGGSMVVRARGRNLRVRTPMCRALRRLNQITERACGSRVCSRAQVYLRARDVCAWARVQAAAHNPRASVALPLRTRLVAFIHALQKRWKGKTHLKHSKISESQQSEQKGIDETNKEAEENFPEIPTRQMSEENEPEDFEDHLNMEPERVIVQEQKLSKKPALHVGPRPETEIHIPLVSPSEQLSSQKICFSSYLERMYLQRRDNDGSSAKIRTSKRQRKDSTTELKETESKKFKIDESENKLINIEETAIDGIELMASFKNNLEDEEKPSTEEELKSEETAEEEVDQQERDKDMSEKEKDSFSEMEDDEKYNKSDTDNESDHGKDKGKHKFKNLKVKFRIRPKKRGGSIYTLVVDKDHEELKEDQVKEEDQKPDIDMDMAVRQIRKGWSVHDAGDLTVGDLYLMFGSRSKLELDYWWAEPTPPLPQQDQKIKYDTDKLNSASDKRDKSDKTPDKGTECYTEDGCVRESETDLLSPKNTFNQDSNDGISGDERKCEQLASPEHKSSTSCAGTFKLVNKLINRPQAPPSSQNGFALMGDRLKRLLSLVGNPHISSSLSPTVGKCSCGHVCPQKKSKPSQTQDCRSVVFRHPPPIAPKMDVEPPLPKPLSLDELPRWRRGRARPQDRPVIVQRLLPLLPKLPPTSNLIPVKIIPPPQQTLAKILPKPPPSQTADFPCFYVLSESNGQFFFHDGDRRIPITTEAEDSNGETATASNAELGNIKNEKANNSEGLTEKSKESEHNTQVDEQKSSNPDIGNFLPTESMSLSPSRLLREAEGWMGGEHDFSLSSFLSHLEGRPQQDLVVDSQLQSLMVESSVDYVAKFADLAKEVTEDPTLQSDPTLDHLT